MNDPIRQPLHSARPVIHPLHVDARAKLTRPRQLFPFMHTTVLATDIVGFGSPHRDIGAQLYIRQMMYELLIAAFNRTRLPWWDCYREDCGDGALIVAPPNIEPVKFLDPLIHQLDILLGRYARRASERTQLHLRMAVHHGRVHYDAHGVTGHALIHLFRLLEAPAFKAAMAAAQTHLGVIVSDQLYTDATRGGGLIDAAAYKQVHLTCKEISTDAWLRLAAASRC